MQLVPEAFQNLLVPCGMMATLTWLADLAASVNAWQIHCSQAVGPWELCQMPYRDPPSEILACWEQQFCWESGPAAPIACSSVLRPWALSELESLVCLKEDTSAMVSEPLVVLYQLWGQWVCWRAGFEVIC